MTPRASAPRFDHLPADRSVLGTGNPAPAISWTTTAGDDFIQTGYELELCRAGAAESSGRVDSPDSVLVRWPGAPLASREQVQVRVRVWGSEGQPSPWSEPASVEAGLLQPSDWTAVPVGAAQEHRHGDERRPPLLRREFELAGEVRRARLHITAHGLYEAELNGVRVGTEELAPGWTSYDHRLRYATHDVTDLLRPGANAFGAWLGEGWYSGRLGFHGGRRQLYGPDLSLLAQLEVELTDGSRVVVATGPSWRAGLGPVLCSGLYDGEVYDARELPRGWSEPGFDDSAWGGVVEAERDPATLVAPLGPPVRCTGDVRPVDVRRTPSGAFLVDFGQNLAGRVRLTVRGGSAGDVVTIRHAEVLQEGELYTRPLRGARATDVYVLDERAEQTFEPRFTVHGFRYAEVTGWPGELTADDLVARVLHTDMTRTGWFTCSDPLLQRLHENVVWGLRSNFVDVPTDCPQRDERLGWTGDIQVFAPTASFLYDCAGMLASWLRDVAVEQLPDGTVPWYVPVVPTDDVWWPPRPGAVWGDVAVLTPATLHERFGDASVLETQYDSARAWVELVDRLAGDDHLWDEGFQLGDWLDPAAPPDDPADARTDRYLVATAYFAQSARVLAQTAEVLGRSEDVKRYGDLAALVREAFAAAHVLPDGRLTSDAQTAYALAICFDLYPDDQARAAGGDRLAALVREADGRVATGFAGVNLVSDALSRTGHLDEAYLLLTQRECPGWLYTVLQGATTMWERWDSQLPDGTVNPGEMTSFNHYALGSVADWLHRVVAGLAPAEPGYRRILVRPRPGGGLTSAGAVHETPYGRASVAWQVDGDELRVRVRVPVGTTADVDLPGAEPVRVGPGEHVFTAAI